MSIGESALIEIEMRWMRASPGPWTIIDYRIPESEEKVEGETRFEQCKNAGMCSDVWGYVSILESQVDDLWPFDSLADRFRIVVAMPGKDYQAATRRADRGDPEPSYSFAIGPDAKPADVELLRHASSDIGQLIAALRSANARIAELEGMR